ncbi:DUF6653 family protein [Mycolicibacterium sp. XJ1819]
MPRLAGMRRAVFARHCNPWSAWSRWATAPLVLVPAWTRSWRHAAWIAVWFAVNPVIFPPPADESAWATRAILGEELWIVERPRDTGMVVNAAGTLAGAIALVAAGCRRAGPAAVWIGAQMALTLVYWQLMAKYFDRHRQQTPRRG